MSFNLQRVLETGDDVHITNRVFNWNWKERCDRWYSEIGIKIGMISNESCDGDKETNEWKGSKLEEEPTESCDVIYAYCCRCCGGETEIQSNVIDARFKKNKVDKDSSNAYVKVKNKMDKAWKGISPFVDV
eukprot:67937_1